MPTYPRTEPALCDHRQAPWLPLCEHAGTVPAGGLGEGDVGRRVTTSRGTGILKAVHRVDEHAVQLLIERVDDPMPVVLTTPVGEVVQFGWGPVP